MRCFCAGQPEIFCVLWFFHSISFNWRDKTSNLKKSYPPLGIAAIFCYSPCYHQMSLFNKKIPYRLRYLHSTADLNLNYYFFPPKGISGKSQILFAIVFTTRYLDLLTSFISLYNTCMKVRISARSQSLSCRSCYFCAMPAVSDSSVLLTQMIYIGCAYATVYLIYMKFRATYDGNHDSFRVEFLVVPVGGLAVLINHDFSFLEVGTTS